MPVGAAICDGFKFDYFRVIFSYFREKLGYFLSEARPNFAL